MSSRSLRYDGLKRWFIPLWLCGCLVTIFQFAVLAEPGLGEGYEPLAVARSLAAGNGFSNPYQPLATGPTAHVAPVYPAIVAGAIWMFGGDEAATVPLVLLHVLIHGLQFALLPALALQLLGDARAGLAACVMLACLPMFPVTIQIETIFQTVLLMLVILVPVRRWNAVPAGLMCALALQVSPSIVFGVAGWLWWRRPNLRWTAIWLISLAAGMAPWAVRNYEALGHLILVRDNLSLELYVSNNDLAGPVMLENKAMATLHPNINPVEAGAVRRMGEVAYMTDRGRQALSWVLSHPAKFASLTAWRIVRYWLPSIGKRRWQGWLIWLVTLLSVPALMRSWRHPIFVSVMIVSPLLYYVIQSDARYRFPYLWATLLLAGWGVIWFVDRVAPELRPARSVAQTGAVCQGSAS